MKNLIITLNALILFNIGIAQTPLNDAHWQLVWEDNFDSLNTNIWKVLDWAVHNDEPQLYIDDNVDVFGGNLIITVKRETKICNPDQNPISWPACSPCLQNFSHKYTSGWIETNEAFNKQYGYIESRIKLPHGKGFWPAFWTWRGVGATNETEVDIFEMNGSKPSTIMGTNIHEEYCSVGGIDIKEYLQPYCINNNPPILWYGLDIEIPSYINWHTYAIEWNPSKIIWYVDGKIVRVSHNPGINDQARIILNFALFPDVNMDTTPFPSKMVINYLRVYELNADNSIINTSSYNFATYNNMVKKSITISGGTTSLSSGDDYTLRATDFIEINGDFSVPVGANLYMDVNQN